MKKGSEKPAKKQTTASPAEPHSWDSASRPVRKPCGRMKKRISAAIAPSRVCAWDRNILVRCGDELRFVIDEEARSCELSK
jgi:hypothetical protein